MSEEELDREYKVVYLEEEGVFGIIASLGAYYSLVKYYKDGVSFEVLVDNEDIL